MKKIINEKILILVSLLLLLPLLVGCFSAPPPPTNQAPTITSTSITTATVAEVYAYNVNATDPDGDTLTYTLTTNPTGMTIDPTTGVISWTPTSTQLGNRPVTVEVSDGSLSDTQSFIIIVSKADIIYPPHPTPPAVVVPVSAITVTGDAVVGATLTAAPTPGAATGTYQWKSSDTADGTYVNITGATSSTYVIEGAYAGKFIKVTFTATGSYTGTQTSVAKGPVVVVYNLATLTAPGAQTLTAAVADAAAAITALDALVPTVAVTTSPVGTTTLPVVWTFTGTFDAASAATNEFTWTATLGDVTNTIPVVVTGTVTVTNFTVVYNLATLTAPGAQTLTAAVVDEAAAITALDALVPTVAVTTDPVGTTTLPVVWTFTGTFDAASAATNVFTWTATLGDVTNTDAVVVTGTVTVTNFTVAVASIVVTGTGDAITITADNGTLQMLAAVLPVDATDATVTWSVADGTGEASINATGLLTAVTDGTVLVIATANDGSLIEGTKEITISNQV